MTADRIPATRRFARRHWVAVDVACAALTIAAMLELVVIGGHRGATTAQTHAAESIMEASDELLRELVVEDKKQATVADVAEIAKQLNLQI